MCSVPGHGAAVISGPLLEKFVLVERAGTIIPSVRRPRQTDGGPDEARSAAAATVAALWLPEIAEMEVRTTRTSASSVFARRQECLLGWMEETTPPNQECKHVQSPSKRYRLGCVKSLPRPEGVRRRDSRNLASTFYLISILQ